MIQKSRYLTHAHTEHAHYNEIKGFSQQQIYLYEKQQQLLKLQLQ